LKIDIKMLILTASCSKGLSFPFTFLISMILPSAGDITEPGIWLHFLSGSLKKNITNRVIRQKNREGRNIFKNKNRQVKDKDKRIKGKPSLAMGHLLYMCRLFIIIFLNWIKIRTAFKILQTT